MTVILFIIILLVLVFVHELGHFAAAKKFGIKVHEFALGFPPVLWKKKIGETLYSLNLIPFGGFVRIHGENAEDELTGEEPERSMVHKPWYIQITVLIAGVTMNFLFAWLLISIAYMSGYPTAVGENSAVTIADPHIVVLSIEKGSPAELAGFMIGDKIAKIDLNGVETIPGGAEDVRKAVAASEGVMALNFSLVRGNDNLEKKIYATSGLVSDRPAIGISMGYIGIVKYNPFSAIYHGFLTTVDEVVSIAVGLVFLIKDAVTGQAELSSVTGPVGIARLVGDASQFGFAYLAGFTAFISLNLAVINLMPFPALDGGRMVVVVAEAISRRKVPATVQLWLNGIGFTLLILLMVVVTIGDVTKLFR